MCPNTGDTGATILPWWSESRGLRLLLFHRAVSGYAVVAGRPPPTRCGLDSDSSGAVGTVFGHGPTSEPSHQATAFYYCY
ncbi:hypothetical protein SRM_00375 [Salinibacter ruber M8]|uniref:Uncharacterized protein n=1 Tax=Salinibacter ruber (strain M8) TaxID=761659 RepID=D5H5J1_SALRM|nr:hypothetical protein SRM_00375 [Salinibacter ruber M8]